MPELHKIAVLYAIDAAGGGGAPVPADAHVRHVMETGANSVRNFWSDNVPYLDLRLTFFPQVSISPDRSAGASTDRGILIAAAQAAAKSVNYDASAFDRTFVIVHGGMGFTFGASGSKAVVFTSHDHSTVCHEFGHIVGFEHPRGYRSLLWGNWTLEYGDPYDVMGFPGDWWVPPGDRFLGAAPANAGPMISRAVVHFHKPQALAESGRSAEFDLHGTPITANVFAAGRSKPGEPELLVFHAQGNRADPKHRIMVELRQPDLSSGGPSRWDGGLDGSAVRDTPGVVVHTIQTETTADGKQTAQRPHWTGTLSLAGSDLDVDVALPSGTYTVAVRSPVGVTTTAPRSAQVTVGRAPLGEPRVRIRSDVTTTQLPVRVEQRHVPGLPPIVPPQTYVVYRTDTRWVLSAYTSNVGGLSALGGPETSTVEWRVNGTPVPAGQLRLFDNGAIQASVGAGTAVVSLTNVQPVVSTSVVAVRVQAWDVGSGGNLVATMDVVFEGESAELQERGRALKRWYELKFDLRYPKPRPPIPRLRIEELRSAFAELWRVAPDLAGPLSPLMEEEEHRWRRHLVDEAEELPQTF